MGTSICHSVISQMINFFVVCCFVNPGSDLGLDPSSDPSSDPGLILSLSRLAVTLIDNIFVDQFFDGSRDGLFFTDISDHLPIFSIQFDTSMSASNETVFVRDVNQGNTTKFLSHLQRIDWSQYATLDDPNNAYNSFFEFSTAYDLCFP